MFQIPWHFQVFQTSGHPVCYMGTVPDPQGEGRFGVSNHQPNCRTVSPMLPPGEYKCMYFRPWFHLLPNHSGRCSAEPTVVSVGCWEPVFNALTDDLQLSVDNGVETLHSDLLSSFFIFFFLFFFFLVFVFSGWLGPEDALWQFVEDTSLADAWELLGRQCLCLRSAEPDLDLDLDFDFDFDLCRYMWSDRLRSRSAEPGLDLDLNLVLDLDLDFDADVDLCWALWWDLPCRDSRRTRRECDLKNKIFY